MKIAITTTSFGKFDRSPLDRLEKENIHYILNPYGRKLNRRETIELAKNTDGIIAGTEPLDKKVLNNLPGLKVISRCGSGLDNVDMEIAKKMGIKVYNTPTGPTQAVAELTIGLILSFLRKIPLMNQELKNSTWKKRMGNLLKGKKIGIIGFGRIGQRVAELLLPFGVETAYFDIREVSCIVPCTVKTLKSLLAWADIVSLHLSTPKEKGPIISASEIQLMKKGAILINTARGNLIDEEALYKALTNDHLAGVALDVFEKEPYKGPLSTLNNVILTPHIGSYALEARISMENEAAENIILGLKQ